MNTQAEPSVRQRIEKALAGKWGFRPTPGPWVAHFDGVTESTDRYSGKILSSCGTRGKTEAEEANNLYIAAVNPAAIQELLAEHDATVQSQRAEIEKLREACQAGEQCIVDFVELYRRGAALLAMDEAVKSLQTDALKSIRAALKKPTEKP